MLEQRKFKLMGWMRALSIIVGIASLIAGLSVLVFPGIGMLLLVSLLSVGLIFIGIERLAVGVSGQVYRFVPSAELREKMKQEEVRR